MRRGLFWGSLCTLLVTQPVAETRGSYPIVTQHTRGFYDFRTGKEVLVNLALLEKQTGWVQRAVEESRREQGVVLVVSKLARKLEVFQNGKLDALYTIALSLRNPLGDKLYQGDSGTPEGVYRIIAKKEGAATRFHKAFLIDYPTLDDRGEFLVAQARGMVPRHVSDAGGDIEIHGFGNQRDWTLGCVGMANRDIDELYPRVKEGARVVIVRAYRR